jgi:NhaA family Na+:H+ antiporter
MDLSTFASRSSLSIIVSRVIGKAIGITLTTALLVRWSKLKLPENLDHKEVLGIGLLSGMGMTVSLVIADITIHDATALSEIRSGLFLAALISGLLGVLWLRRFPASL